MESDGARGRGSASLSARVHALPLRLQHWISALSEGRMQAFLRALSLVGERETENRQRARPLPRAAGFPGRSCGRVSPTTRPRKPHACPRSSPRPPGGREMLSPRLPALPWTRSHRAWALPRRSRLGAEEASGGPLTRPRTPHSRSLSLSLRLPLYLANHVLQRLR